MTVEDLQYWLLSRLETGELKEQTPISVNFWAGVGDEQQVLQYEDLVIKDDQLVIEAK